jgi:O-antigen/teichoic acid export membrane protein
MEEPSLKPDANDRLRVGRAPTRPRISATKLLTESLVVRNAASLYGSSVVTSLLGFVYWFVAAKSVPAAEVGIASAIQSAALFLSFFCVLGLSTLLLSELSSDKTNARSLILTAVTGAGAFALIVSAGVGLALGDLSETLRAGLVVPIGLLVFTLMSTVNTLVLITDDSCIGLLRATLQFRRNTVFAVSKLILLPVLIYVWKDSSGIEIVVAWLLGLAISLTTTTIALGRLTKGESSRLDFRRIFENRRLMFGHHSLNISIQSPRLLIPVVVATVIGSRANAAYTAAMLVVAFVNVIPVHLSTVLFALTPGDEVTLRREVGRTMWICLFLALASGPFFFLTSHFILGVFGPKYQAASTALAILGFTTYPLAIKAHYVAINRARGRMQRAASRSMIGACLEIGLAIVGAWAHGLTGVAAGYLIAVVTEAFLFSPVVFGVLRTPRGKHASSAIERPERRGPRHRASRTGRRNR